jgi:lycopene cyclase domain-containing protein
MATYFVLNTLVLTAMGLCVWGWPARLHSRWIAVIAAAMLVLTAVFDPLIIHFNIVAYDMTKILGAYIGRAPVEDFAYTLAAAVLVPYIWKRLGRDR